MRKRHFRPIHTCTQYERLAAGTYDVAFSNRRMQDFFQGPFDSIVAAVKDHLALANARLKRDLEQARPAGGGAGRRASGRRGAEGSGISMIILAGGFSESAPLQALVRARLWLWQCVSSHLHWLNLNDIP
jgi:hypothetical protein